MSDITVQLRGDRLPACPYCRDSVEAGKACSECQTRYHSDCAWQLGDCALLGCQGSFRSPRRSLRSRAAKLRGVKRRPRRDRIYLLTAVAAVGLIGLFINLPLVFLR